MIEAKPSHNSVLSPTNIEKSAYFRCPDTTAIRSSREGITGKTLAEIATENFEMPRKKGDGIEENFITFLKENQPHLCLKPFAS